jgi:hypothetical protein
MLSMRKLLITGLMLSAGCTGIGGGENLGRSSAADSVGSAQNGANAGGSGGMFGPRYQGGPVLSNVKILAVFWGSKVSSTVTSGVPGFYSALADSEYLDKLDEYYASSPLLNPIGRGTYAGGVTISPRNTSTSLADNDIQVEIAAQISARALPLPDANTLYMVHLPPGITINNGESSSCVANTGFCAYHGFGTQALSGVAGTSFTSFQYVVAPDYGSGSGCDTGCGTGTELQNITANLSHEISDAITDPESNGWWGLQPGDEIGETCNQIDDTITDSTGTQYTVQKTWSHAANACVTVVPDCQGASDTYGIVAGTTYGLAPLEVQAWWTANGCDTSPNPLVSTDACQKMSEVYGIVAGQTFGYAPDSVQKWWIKNKCTSSPLTSDSLCQRASDTYGIVAGQTFGSAPSDVVAWWKKTGCPTSPRSQSACQMAAELYGIVPGQTFGDAPTSVQTWWSASGCHSAPINNVCQNAVDRYGIVPGGTNMGFAPPDVVTWWNATCLKVQTSPGSGNSCQRASELYGIVSGQTFGFAPASVQTWWQAPANGCSTAPLFSVDVCQRASNTYGIIAGVDFGFAPPDVVTWWENNCGGSSAHPRTVTKNFQPDPSCGAAGEAVCFGASCEEGAVPSGSQCVSCGGLDDVPCTASSECGSGGNCATGCTSPLGVLNGTCEVCGTSGAVPCTAGCNAPLGVLNGTCEACGTSGAVPCTAGCNDGLVSANIYSGSNIAHVCVSACGNLGQLPCTDGPMGYQSGLGSNEWQGGCTQWDTVILSDSNLCQWATTCGHNGQGCCDAGNAFQGGLCHDGSTCSWLAWDGTGQFPGSWQCTNGSGGGGGGGGGCTESPYSFYEICDGVCEGLPVVTWCANDPNGAYSIAVNEASCSSVYAGSCANSDAKHVASTRVQHTQ